MLEHLSAFDKGRIQAHHMSKVRESLEMFVKSRNDDGMRRKRMLEDGALPELLSSRYRNSFHGLVNGYFLLLTNHYMYCFYKLHCVKQYI